jgi:hypothetical protein
MSWVDDPVKWDRLAERLLAAGEAGIDTETYGQQDGQSPQYRARVHCWSLGLLTDQASPRGYRKAIGVVLPRRALDHTPLVKALSCVKLWAHNAPHDKHSLWNEGLDLSIEDTLQWLRAAVPGRRDYGLKDAEQWALGYGPRPGFLDMVKYQRTEVKARRHVERGCICGKQPCRARQASDWLADDGVWRPHLRVEWRVFTPTPKTVEARYEVTNFVPGALLAPLVWQGQTLDRLTAWWAYSLADAVRGVELVDWLRNRRQVTPPYPWS